MIAEQNEHGQQSARYWPPPTLTSTATEGRAAAGNPLAYPLAPL
jgi:hypothetical protein